MGNHFKHLNEILVRRITQSSIFDFWLWFWLVFTLFPILNSIVGRPLVNIGSVYLNYITLFLFCLPLIIFFYGNFGKFISLFQKSRINKIIFFTICVVLLVKLFTLFYYTLPLEAPILHDPYEHALLAKTILVEDQINYFYSPLLHAAVASLSFGEIWQIPQVTVLVNNLSVFMIPALLASLFHYFFKKPKYTLILFLILSCLHFPGSLYFINGKYALVAAISLIPVCIYYISELSKSSSLKNILKVVISLFFLFLAHYPTFGILCYLIIPWILFLLGRSLQKKQFKEIVLFVSPFLLTIIISVLWMAPRYHIQQELLSESVAAQAGESAAVIFDIKAMAKNLIELFETFFRSSFHITYASNFQAWHIFLLIPLFTNIIKKEVKFSIVWAYFSLIILSFIINTLSIGSFLGMVTKTLEIIYTPMFMTAFIFVLVIIFTHLQTTSRQLYLLICFLLGAFAFSSYYLYSQLYSSQQRFNLIDENDLKAFEYINTNLPDQSTFLTAGHATSSHATVSPVDGGMWLPLYTGNSVTADFTTFSSFETNEYYNILLKIKTDADDSEAIDLLKSMGVGYAYIDQGVWAEGIKLEDLSPGLYTILFESETVKVVEFL